jgi:hypothetical protein
VKDNDEMIKNMKGNTWNDGVGSIKRN